ncbi:transmembrane protease serine 13-like [Brachionus plicatilis]|uniref:Transmembrane protease serine 13-like n=1 Tax=Brachionus plicatilis TaxID=10195 RepID=A0A3M7PYT8_BRAPC|nr:transmembrane protease serine 13-like [Brachionus plicatilis]
MRQKFLFILTIFLANQSIKCQNLKKKTLSDPSILIINGETAPSDAFPFIVSLGLINQTSYRHRCGANIISQDFILTAAHCVKDIGNDYDPQSYRRRTGKSLVIIAGTQSLNPLDSNKDTEIYLIQRISYNINYRSITDPFDIAILKTAKRITFNSRVKTISLPSTSNPAVVFGRKLTVVGWGITESGKLSTKLQMTAMTSINFMGLRGECGGLDSKFYCMKDLTSDKSNACYGDSGGPLIRMENNRWVLFGLTSFGQNDNDGNCLNNLPSFFTMVPSLLSWIRMQTQNSFSLKKQGLSLV